MEQIIDLPIIDKFNAVGGTFVLLFTYFLGDHWYLFAALLALNFLDYVTGIMKSTVLKTKSSSAGFRGIVKKFSQWVMVILAFGLVPIANDMGDIIGADVSGISPAFGYFVLGALLINEFRSILENMVEMGVDLPVGLVKGLAVLEKLPIVGDEADIDGDIRIHTESDKVDVNLRTPKEELVERGCVTLRIKTTQEEE